MSWASAARVVEAELGLGRDEVEALGRRGVGGGPGTRNGRGAGAGPARPLIFFLLCVFSGASGRPSIARTAIISALSALLLIGQSEAVGAQDRCLRRPGRFPCECDVRMYFACQRRCFTTPARGEPDVPIERIHFSPISCNLFLSYFLANLIVSLNPRLSVGADISSPGATY